MKIRAGFLALFATATAALAEDKVSGELDGVAEVVGISEAGVLVGDLASDTYARHPTTAKVSVVTKEGRVHRVETYFDWSAANGVRARVWERLYVLDGTYTGWTERLIQTPATIAFSRNVIDGNIDQKFGTDGSGYVEWTVAGADNGVEVTGDSSTGATDTSTTETLPTVEILEEGEFDGVSDRRIEIHAHDGDHPSIDFRDTGYQRITTEDSKGVSSVITVNQKLEFSGHGKGSLSFIPSDHADPTPTPTATPLPATTPTPTPDPVDG